MSKAHHQAPNTQVTLITRGRMAKTFKVDLDSSAPTFYVKFPTITYILIQQHQLESNADIQSFTDDLFEQEFLSLSLLNLLGIKTPTEIALLKHEEGSILFKKAAGDGEKRSAEPPDDFTPDDAYETRLDVLLDLLCLTDVRENMDNIIPVHDRHGKTPLKTRYVVIDPLLEVNEHGDCALEKLLKKTPNDTLRHMQKTLYYYHHNAEKIAPSLRKLDMHMEAMIEDNCRQKLRSFIKNTPHASRKERALKASELEASKAHIFANPENHLPSQRLQKAMQTIQTASEARGIAPYLPNPNGAYLARKVPPTLDQDTLLYALQSIHAHTAVTQNTLHATVTHYCASNAKQLSFECDINMHRPAKTTFQKQPAAFVEKEKGEIKSCTIS